jgi:hypothetical protein
MGPSTRDPLGATSVRLLRQNRSRAISNAQAATTSALIHHQIVLLPRNFLMD